MYRTVTMCEQCTKYAVWENGLCALCLGVFVAVEPEEDRETDDVTCRIENCDRDIYIKKHRLCTAHYQSERKRGEI